MPYPSIALARVPRTATHSLSRKRLDVVRATQRPPHFSPPSPSEPNEGRALSAMSGDRIVSQALQDAFFDDARSLAVRRSLAEHVATQLPHEALDRRRLLVGRAIAGAYNYRNSHAVRLLFASVLERLMPHIEDTYFRQQSAARAAIDTVHEVVGAAKKRDLPDS